MNKYNIVLTFFFLFTIAYLHAQIGPATCNNTGGSAMIPGAGYFAWSVGEPVIGSIESGSTTLTQGVLQTWPDTFKNLALTLYLEGLFNGTTMNKAKNAIGDNYPGDIADKITIELHNALNYSNIIYSASDIALSTTGHATISIPGRNYGSYYVTVKHRNSIETTSATPVSFNTGNINYAFDAPAKAYSNNLKPVNGNYCLYAGDVNSDGKVDMADISAIQSNASAFYSGYLTTDVNGDGVIDAFDLILTDNNSSTFVVVHKP